MVDVSCGRRVEWSCEPGAEAGMNFDFGEQHEAFRKDVRHWLETHLPDDLRGRAFAASRADVAEVKKLRAWQHTMHAAGYVGMDWPREFGGRGASIVEMVILYQEMARAESPQFVNRGGISMLGPTLMKHGTPAQQQRFLPKILTAEEMWCQGFSEPNAGSDLAAVRTRAELRGDTFHVSGQKIWTSYARFAEWCILVTRTDFQAPKHKGITFLLVDMTSPGITIRPLVEMTGVAWFNEVFFDDVRVPRENVVGEVNGGWTIVITTLAHERSGSAPHARIQGEMRDILDLARRVGRDGQPAAADPRARQRLAQSFIETEILRGLAYKNVSEIMRNGQPGPEGSCLKLVWSEVDQRMKDLALDMQGPYGDLERGAPRAIDGGRWQYEYL